jgi:RHS repeat-associated protein
MTYPNGVVTTYGYDGESRLTSLAASRNGTPITSFTYDLDSVGNRTRKTTLDWAEDYHYDELYRLVAADRSAGTPSRWRFGYDPAGNRTGDQTDDAAMAGSFNNLNQLLARQAGGALTFKGTTSEPATVAVSGKTVPTSPPTNAFSAQAPVPSGASNVVVTATDSSGNTRTNTYQVSASGAGATYTYDPNGNLAQKTEGTDNWAYTWNAENQLTKVEKNGVEQARFAYDPRGRRVEKLAGGVTTSYTYDDFNILREGRGAAVLKYVYGPRADEALAIDDGATVSCLHADAFGSIVAVSSSAGVVTMTRQYDAWGYPLVGDSQAGVAYTGREWDPEVGLYYYRSRFYDPKLGRFISPDAIGFEGGDNFYVYVSNSPVNAIDPFGFCGLGGCKAKMSPAPRPPAPMECIAPADYPCDCGFEWKRNDGLYDACIKSLGAAGGGPSGGRGTAYFGRNAANKEAAGASWGQKSEARGARRRQGTNACVLGGLVMVINIFPTCEEAAMECVPQGRR